MKAAPARPPSAIVAPTTVVCRVLLLAALAALLAFRAQADGAVAAAWQYLRASPLFKHDSFEPAISVLSFFLFVPPWMLLDTRMPSLAKWRIQASAEMSSWVGFSMSGVFLKQELWAYILPLAAFDALYPRRSLPVEPPSALRLLVEVAAGLVLYDALFFCCHLAFHRVPLLAPLHAKHHRLAVVNAMETLSLSYVEQAVDVGCSIVALNVLRLHPMSRSLYNVVIIYMLVELHCGYDFPWMIHRVMPAGLMGGPPAHDLHHRTGRSHYQKFFTYLDVALGHGGEVTPAMAKAGLRRRLIK